MMKLCIFVGMMAGSYAGYWAGNYIGPWTAFFVSGAGALAGVYAGWKVARRWE